MAYIDPYGPMLSHNERTRRANDLTCAECGKTIRDRNDTNLCKKHRLEVVEMVRKDLEGGS